MSGGGGSVYLLAVLAASPAAPRGAAAPILGNATVSGTGSTRGAASGK